jgi:nucleotide-binding universal stress UspA family protein
VAGELLAPRLAHLAVVWTPAESSSQMAVGDPLTGGPAIFMPEVDDALHQRAAATAERGAELARAAGFEVETGTPTASAPWQALVRLADAVDAAAIVVGARGVSRLESALIGSTSNGVLHHTARPVLVVHEPDPG